MLYQKLLSGDAPYHLSAEKMTISFEEHRHPEAEFLFCLKGNFKIKIDKILYTVNAGSMALVSPMSAHEIPKNDTPDCYWVYIKVGPSFLRKIFEFFSSLHFTSPVITLNSGINSHKNLLSLLEETYHLHNNKTDFSEMQIIGNIYKICGYILSEFTEKNVDIHKNMKNVANIEKALDMIHTRYTEPITVDMAAEITGYGKSNFCKIFKSITGDTFHNMLNRQRVENAGIYLKETSMSVADIALAVGFADAKSFCRVFRSVKGVTTGEYRKKHNTL